MFTFWLGCTVAIVVIVLLIAVVYIVGKRYDTFSFPGPYEDYFLRLPKHEQKRHYLGDQEVAVYASWREFILGKSIYSKVKGVGYEN